MKSNIKKLEKEIKHNAEVIKEGLVGIISTFNLPTDFNLDKFSHIAATYLNTEILFGSEEYNPGKRDSEVAIFSCYRRAFEEMKILECNEVFTFASTLTYASYNSIKFGNFIEYPIEKPTIIKEQAKPSLKQKIFKFSWR
ncbi:hypothetical protein JXM83_06425 [Candidatus Woesearchaeota archaeon]|nr:hypothetical protein [Candidatus Woesearchaeota archaeon]